MKAKEFIFEDEPDLIDAIRDFLPLAIEHLKLKSLPKIIIEKDVVSKHDQPTFGKYENKHEVISLDIEERHPIDVIRTLAHELVHYLQDKEGRLNHNSWKTGSADENEAHDKAGEMMRMFDKQFPKYMKLHAIQFNENFADGRNPQDKGDAKRHGINTKASVSSLRKTAKQGGRKGQLAHWLANMKAGRAKHK